MISRIILILTLIPAVLSGQSVSDPEKLLRKMLADYCSAYPREEMYVHTDRDQYIAGEELWSELYLFDRKSGSLTGYRTIAYIELLNQSNTPVLRKKIIINRGTGPASLNLPDTLSTGRYILRAYTNWMKNFMPGNCFTKKVLIYNAMNSAGRIPAYKDPCDDTSEYEKGKKGSARYDNQIKVIHHVNGDLQISLKARNITERYPADCILLIQSRGNVSLIDNVRFINDLSTVSVPSKFLPAGINELVLFDNSLNILCSKFIYRPVSTPAIPVISFPDSVKCRNLAVISVKNMPEQRSLFSTGGFSISVVTDLSPVLSPDLEDYMVFGSEFGSLPSCLFSDKLANKRPEEIDSVLSSRRSSWIDWNNLLKGRFPEIRYPKEQDSHYLNGRLLDKISGKPFSGKYVFLSYPGKVAGLQNSRTDSAGNFSFILPLTDEPIDLVIQPEEAKLQSSVMIMPSFCDNCCSEHENSDSSVVKVAEYINKWAINYQVNKIYGIGSGAEPVRNQSLLPVTGRFYGKPDIELVMDDYVKLPLMEEVFFELTPGVILKKRKGSYSVSMADPASGRIYEKDPLVMIDGVVINDLTPLAALDPELVEKIDIVKDLYMVGNYIFFGIVNVITREGHIGNISLPEYAVRMKYRVADKSGIFVTPDYSDSKTREARIPDFRNTLFWSPLTRFEENGQSSAEFWSSDIAGKYRISINGTDNLGNPFSIHRIIKVY